MGRLSAKGDYETLRNVRILENQERLESLGLQKTISELRSIISSSKSVRKYQKVDYSRTPLRRSNRLNGTSPEFTSDHISMRRSSRLRGNSFYSAPPPQGKVSLFGDSEGEKKRSCLKRGSGSVYDAVFGICCHFCRQKNLCGEEDCERCNDLDIDKPCIGKTDCSVCHSSSGVLCRACLKIRYGEEMEVVRENKQWMCPHCIEEKEINPNSICNSSLCLKKRKMDPTGLAIYREQLTTTLGTMGRLSAKSDYETLRNARILENQALLASLGLQKTISELRSASPTKSVKTARKFEKVDYSRTSLRRSSRLTGNSSYSIPSPKGEVGLFEDTEGEEKRPANAPLLRLKGSIRGLSPDALARRCLSRGRGSVYDPVFGICCHFCRQKKLCGEEDCKRCSDLDIDQPCIGKTDCSMCHSSNGVLCRACLKVRYGEEMEEVRENKQWMCPHCIEEKGINPYWICNSSLCLKKRKMVPTGIAIYRAREMGYKSVAHLLMDELQQRRQ